MEKRKIELTLSDLTLGDMEAYEDATGQDLMTDIQPKRVINPRTGMPVPDPDSPDGRPLLQATLTARTFTGLVYLGALRDDPTLDFKTVRTWKLADIDFHLNLESPDESTPLENSVPEHELPESENGSLSPSSSDGLSMTSDDSASKSTDTRDN